MKPAPFVLIQSATTDEALATLAEHGGTAKPVGGTQSLGPMLNLRLARPETMVDVSRIPELRRVREEDGAIVYGAAVTHAEIEDGAVPDATPGWLAAAARGIAYRAVRNRGTLGGSLAHADPAADWVSVLSALGAELVLLSQGPEGRTERVIGLPGFFTGAFATDLRADEIIAEIRVPRRAAPARWAYVKYCRKVGEFAKASAAILIDPARGETRILVGAIERPPVLLPCPEAILDGTQDIHAAIAETVPDLPPSATRLHAGMVRKAVRSVRAEQGESR